MPDVVRIAVYEMPIGTDRSAFVESVEPSWDMDVQESRPFTSGSVKKDPGLYNNSYQVTFVDDASATIAQYLFGARGTKVTFLMKWDEAAVSPTNPKFTGTAVVPPTVPPIRQGDLRRFTVTFQVDGDVTIATA